MKKGTVYFFTGLAGAGKTTIGGLFYQRLQTLKPDAVLIDGDKNRDKANARAPRDYSLCNAMNWRSRGWMQFTVALECTRMYVPGAVRTLRITVRYI